MELQSVLRSMAANLSVQRGVGCLDWQRQIGTKDVPRVSDYRLVNFVRDPFELIVSKALYDLRGDESKSCLHAGGDKAQLLHRTHEARSGIVWPPAQVVPTVQCHAGLRCSCESYWEYLSRLERDPRFGRRTVVLVTSLLLAMPTQGGQSVGPQVRGLSFLETLAQGARSARLDRRAVNVCLDDFMTTDAEIARAWRRLLSFIDPVHDRASAAVHERIVSRMLPAPADSTGSTKVVDNATPMRPDEKVSSSASIAAAKVRHATAGIAGRFAPERLALLHQAREMDARYLGGRISRIAAEFNCSGGGAPAAAAAQGPAAR